VKNIAHVQTSFYLLFETEMDKEEFQNMVNAETVVGSEVKIVLPDGNTYNAVYSVITDMHIEEFEDNSLVDKEKVTDNNISDQIAI
jgi:hypothetical protein